MISVIIPLYNNEKYFEKCINSIINQTYRNIEIIIVNDGSIDNSFEIAKEYANIDNRIKLIDKKNSGVSNTRNIGIENSNGEYVIFIDSDDYLNIDYLERLICFNKEKYDVIKSGINLVNKNGKTIDKYLAFDNNKKFSINDAIYLIKKTNFFNSACAQLIKKSLLSENKIKFNDQINYGEDLLFNVECLNASSSNIFITTTGYNYFQNESSASNIMNIDKRIKYIDDNIYIYNLLSTRLNHNFNEIIVKKIIYGLRKITGCKIKYKEFKHIYKDLDKRYNFNKNFFEKNEYKSFEIYILRLKLLYIYYLLFKIYYKLKKK